jgi:hypothetical protein
MKILTNVEYNQMQYIICKLRSEFAYSQFIIADRTEYGSTSYWLNVREYWKRKAEYWKSLGNKGSIL